MSVKDTLLLESIVAIVLLLLVFCGTVFLLKHAFWGPRIKRAFQAPLAKFGLVMSIIFFACAWMDSIAWRDDVASDNKAGLQAREARTILDRLFAASVGVKEFEYKARTHSAPLADTEFYDSNIALTHKHLLGTDISGNDTLYLILKGIRPAVIIGTLPLALTLPIAILLGILAGYLGGIIDDAVVYVYTVLASIPTLLLLIVMISALGKSMLFICIALGITSWVSLCRLIRAETFKLRELEYIQAAKCLGVPSWKIILKHILPNLTHIVLISSILTFTVLVLSESILAYLGIGLEESWGAMIATAKSEVAQDPIVWWNLLFASIALFLLILAANIVGDSLRDALDPKTSSE